MFGVKFVCKQFLLNRRQNKKTCFHLSFCNASKSEKIFLKKQLKQTQVELYQHRSSFDF